MLVVVETCISSPQDSPHAPSTNLNPNNPNRELLIRLSTERRCPAGLAVCAVVKDEAAYIQEWLAFHLHSGVQHFYLYLNGNEDGTMTALKPFVDVRRRLFMPRLPVRCGRLRDGD